MTPELQPMAAGFVAVRTVDRFLGPFDGLVVKLHHCPAAHTNEVVVVRVPVGVLETPCPLIGAGATGKPCLGEKFDRAENCRLADGGVNSARGREKLLGGYVAFESKKGVKHCLAGACHLLPTLAEISFENFSLLTAHRLPPFAIL